MIVLLMYQSDEEDANDHTIRFEASSGAPNEQLPDHDPVHKYKVAKRIPHPVRSVPAPDKGLSSTIATTE